MAGKRSIPAAFVRQFHLEHSPQSVGFLQGNVIPVLEPANQPGNVSTTNSAIYNKGLQPAQNTALRCNMISYGFADGFKLNGNAARSYLLIQNKGATTMYVFIGSSGTDSDTFAAIEIVAGGSWEPPVVPTNMLYMTGQGVVAEGTTP